MRLHVRRSPHRTRPRTAPLRGIGPFLALALVAVSTAAFNQGALKSPTVADYLRRSSIAGRHLRVGVFADQPLLSTRVGADRYTGFDATLATFLARSIGVSPDFVPLEPTERLAALTSGRVDVVLAGLVITAERQRVVEFAGPYLVGHLMVATRTTWPPRAGPGRLCMVPGSTAAGADRLGHRILLAPDLGRCLAAVRAGRADAVAGDEILLRGLVWVADRAWRLVPFDGVPIAQSYGIGVARGDPALKALVDSFLVASLRKKTSGAWQVAMDATLGPAGYTGSQPYVTGRLLRDASDGQHGTGGIVGLPAAVPPVLAGRPRRSRTVRHRRRRRRSGRTITRRPAAVGRAPAGDPASHGVAPGASTPGVWSLLVGVPVAVSALYLWIQSGGDRQFTLMLAQSINPINFLATVSLSVVWVFPAAPALGFTIGAVVLGTAVNDADRQRLCARYPVARWTDRAPGGVVWGSVLAAAASTPLVFAPAWALALCVVGRAGSGRRAAGHRLGSGVAFTGLLLLCATIAGAALVEGEAVLALIAGWPVALLLTGADAPLRPGQVTAFVRAAAGLTAVLALGVLHAVVTTPILPSTAIQVAVPTAAKPTPTPSGSLAVVDPDTVSAADPPTRQLRGYVVSVDDESTTLLSDRGGVEIVANDEIRSRVSCPSLIDLPGDSAELFGLPLRESLLKALARQQRPTTVQDPRCLLRVDG
ncbi:transporter substrate-binding domain-containing protein [Micromonospora matsumotoense]|uniref:transporter substrate-binding domain-containing protein n=1 Tax=Micromonospora matsumotoense TaxID=121616 RepID=UPI0033EED5D0